jgi:hypothetical protein
MEKNTKVLLQEYVKETLEDLERLFVYPLVLILRMLQLIMRTDYWNLKYLKVNVLKERLKLHE